MRAIVGVLLLATLAGCAEEPLAPEQADTTFEGLEAEVTDETGISRGVVVDASITPVVDARVVLRSSGDEARTNDNGAFLFSDLDPGTYFLDVSKPGFIGAQSSATVEAGVESPGVVKVLLDRDPAGTPYVNAYSFNGRIECGTNVVALCGGVRDFTGLGEDTYSSLYDTEGNITHLQSEMVWENTQSFGDSFSVNHRYATQEQFDGGFYEGGLTRGTGPSPLLVITDVEAYNENRVGDDYELLLSIFAGPSSAVSAVGVALSQDYQMFIHEFHGYAPPEGWRFTDGAGVPRPQ